MIGGLKFSRPFLFPLFVVVPGWLALAIAAGANGAPHPEESAEYKITANGRAVFAQDTPAATVASFDLAGRAEVVIETKRDVKWADVRPQRLGVRPVVDGRSIRFSLDQPCKISLELNGEPFRQPLFLFADPPETNAPQPSDSGVHYFEGGRIHEAGAIHARSGETVYLAPGAVVRGWIHAEKAHDVRILGRGILLGTGTADQPGRKGSRFVQFVNCTNVLMEGITLADSPGWQVVPTLCENVTIRNVKIVSDNGGDDGIDIVSSRKVRVADCFIRTKDDCIAIKSFAGPHDEPGTREVEVSQCVLWNAAWGNALEIGFELRATEVRDIAFRDCDVIHVEDGAVFSIHNGDFATVRNILFENIRVEDARQKLFDLAIFLTQYSLDRPPSPQEREKRYLHGAWDGVLEVAPHQREFHAPHRGHIRDVVFKDIAVVDGLFPFSVIAGFDDEHRVSNVTFENVTVHGRKCATPEGARLHLEHAENIRFK